MRETFRGLVVVSTFIYVVYWVLPFIDWRWVPPEILELRSFSGVGAQLEIPNYVDYILLAAWILAAIGMYIFKASARTLFLWLYIVTMLTDPFRGTVIHTGLDWALISLSTLLDGAIIAIAYLTSVERCFVQGSTELT